MVSIILIIEITNNSYPLYLLRLAMSAVIYTQLVYYYFGDETFELQANTQSVYVSTSAYFHSELINH